MAERFIQLLFQRHGEQFRDTNNLSAIQLKAMNAIEKCSTGLLGYHRVVCESCGHHQVVYNSCRNRHCPHCQWVKQEVWVDGIKSQLLPVKYAHLVFTLPDFLNEFVLLNHQLIYNMLFEASWHAVNRCCLSCLEAQTGALSVLHTWGQNLSLHPHVHMLVPAGGLDTDGMQWISSAKGFFLPIRALSRIFRARMLFLLRDAVFGKQLRIPEKWRGKNIAEELRGLSEQKDWVVHLEKSRLSPTKVVEYLGRYIQRVAISNHRVIAIEGDNVSFHYKDYSDKGKKKTMTLPAMEFIRRFMQHILPKGFCKVRYYGILSIRNRKEKLIQCLGLLNKILLPPRLNGLSISQIIEQLTGKNLGLCPACGNGTMRILKPPESE